MRLRIVWSAVSVTVSGIRRRAAVRSASPSLSPIRCRPRVEKAKAARKRRRSATACTPQSPAFVTSLPPHLTLTPFLRLRGSLCAQKYPPIPLAACMQAWKTKTSPSIAHSIQPHPSPSRRCPLLTCPSPLPPSAVFSAVRAIEGYHCPRCHKATTAYSSPSFLSFPDHLLMVMRRFLFDSWVPTKLDVSVPLQPTMDLEELRGKGLQAGEEELPASAAVAAAVAPAADASIVSQLQAMGFSANAATRAVSYRPCTAPPTLCHGYR